MSKCGRKPIEKVVVAILQDKEPHTLSDEYRIVYAIEYRMVLEHYHDQAPGETVCVHIQRVS